MLQTTTHGRSRLWQLCSLLCIGFTVLVVFAWFPPTLSHAAGETVKVVLTTTDQQNKLTPQNDISFSNGVTSQSNAITVNENITYQQMVGFGASFNGSSVWEMENKLNQSQRDTLMTNLFDPTNGIGMSMLRQPVAGSDQNAPNGPCSYDDNGGTADSNLTNFSINDDISSHRIDLIHQAMQLNSQLKVMATTWCVPQWMLSGSNNDRTLDTQYYGTYANYLVKFIQAYAAQNPSIPIWAITPQNEPVYSYADFGNNITADQENTLIKNNLGPAFANNNINTKILAYDHNWDHPEYPERILGDSATNPYVAGVAWHRYEGNVGAQNRVHNEYPDKDTIYSEDSPPTNNNSWSDYMPAIAQHIIDYPRNWSRTFIEWTIASNTSYGPGSCTFCGAMVYVDDATGNVTYSLDYYALGHVSKYVKPGAYRIDSRDLGSGNIRDIAYKNPDGSKALIAYNDNTSSQAFTIQWGNENFSYTLPAKGLATFTWSGTQDTAAQDRSNWTATSSTGDATQAIDGDIYSRWSTGHSQDSSLNDYIQIDMGSQRLFSQIVMDSGLSASDYARSYLVYATNDTSNWGNPIASGTGNGQVVKVSFPLQNARYIKVVDTSSTGWWWSIANFNVYTLPDGGLNRTSVKATASSTYSDQIPGNALDANADTRWSSGNSQSASRNDFFSVDLGSAQNFNRIVMDSGSSTGDYAHGYAVYVSNNGTDWGSPVATGTGTTAVINVALGSQNARYIKVVQTGDSNAWWSIAEFYVYS